ncbi:MAG: elongation factor Ts [Rhodobacteraceae bacterium]|nr:elongation factor Ts [Paracoccaceae bacterium]MCP5340631.1 elongation factor Ts [Paracoccaceae bacterium]
MAITAQMVKELRDSTGAGMMDAKKALTETAGDMDAAVDWLRTKGLAKAAKKSGRVAAEGLIGVSVAGGRGVAVEVNSETDFVAKNDEFQGIVRAITEAAMDAADLDALNTARIGGKPVSEVMTDAIAKIGENMTLRRMAAIEGNAVVSYVHNAAADGLGKIGVLVAYEGADAELARGIAMHIAAINPLALDEGDLDSAVVEKERELQIATALEENAKSAKPKPENIIRDNIIPGRMKKFLSDVTLVNQAYVKSADGKTTVGQAAKDGGITVTGFVRVAVGEGIEKKSEDFAAEVAKTRGA